ncbi:hypothetical protein EBZ39_18085 [bacterium]|nr:hypothetical protein [bacterium]
MTDTTTIETTTTSRRRWTEEENQYMRENASKGAKALAEHFGRNVSQIQTQARRLGLSLRQPGSTRGRKKVVVESA